MRYIKYKNEINLLKSFLFEPGAVIMKDDVVQSISEQSAVILHIIKLRCWLGLRWPWLAD